MMIRSHTAKYRFLMRATFILGSAYFVSAQPLPVEWWRQDSPENVLAKAQKITFDLPYLRESKVRTMDEKGSSIEYFQRKASDGTVETKTVIYARGNMQNCEYQLESGTYFYSNDQLVKTEYPEGDRVYDLYAVKFDHPYEYQILKPETVGTNDCIVVARIMSPQFLDAMEAVLFRSYTSEQKAIFGDPKKYIRSEKDYYIRKNDGVVIGFLQKNNSGDVLENWLYDVVQIDSPIADGEFVLPTEKAIIAASFDDFKRIVGQRIKEAVEKRKLDYPIRNKPLRYAVIGSMAVSFGVLLFVLIRFRRWTPNSAGDSEH